MELLGWVWWLATKIVGFVLGLVWFLLGGWVAAIAQIAVIALVIFGYKYGWRRAPQEILARGGTVGRFLWGWMRAREMAPSPVPAPAPRAARETVRQGAPVRQPGDVNLSTLLNVLMLAGLAAAAIIG